MRRAAQRTTEKSAACWSGPLLLGLQRLRIELRPTTPGSHGALPGAVTARSRASMRPGAPEERLEILGFVSTSELSWIHLDRPYYISSPDENTRLYTVLREILVRSDRLAVGQLVLRRRRQLVAIYGFRGALVMHTLRASTDILDPRELGVAADVSDDEQWSPGPWKTAKPPVAAAPKPARRAAGTRPAATARSIATRKAPRRTTGAIATEVGGVRVLDFTAALKRRRELGSLSPGTPRQRKRTLSGSGRRSVGPIE
ncbi:MAG TPA: Ku protein [Gemmatimonadales bacterium]|nr:Ku protein [Gemmatimonadales bacterium]